VDACARVPACGVRRARGSARRARRRVRESLDKEKPTLSAKTEPRRQGPRKSLTPCVGGVWKCFQSRARVAFSGTSRDCLPVRSRGWKTKANPTPKKPPNFPGEIPRLPRERAIGADSTRDGRLTPESTSESASAFWGSFENHRASVEGPGGKRGQYPRFAARRDRTRASPLNRAMVTVSKARVFAKTSRRSQQRFSNRRGCCLSSSRRRIDGHIDHARAFPAASL